MVLPLFHQGIVLRVRQIDGDADDSTVKLRPCRRSQLSGSWLGATKGEGWRLAVEEDWAGNRRALAASCISELPQGRIASVRAGTAPVRRLSAKARSGSSRTARGRRSTSMRRWPQPDGMAFESVASGT
jgi:hypothetical protein